MKWGPAYPRRPRLAWSLRRLGRAVDQRWPERETASDGWLGDAEHATRISDHNPDEHGIVHAVDIDVGGLNPVALLNAVLRHPGVHYAIYDHRIYSRRNDFKAAQYGGVNPHVKHLHVSIYGGLRSELSRARWL